MLQFLMDRWVLLGIGGVLGTFSRYSLSKIIYDFFGTGLPYGTMVVNILGCGMIGVLSVLSDSKFLIGPNGKMMLVAGFCGGFTTFSTYILESIYLMRSGEMLRAVMNLSLSVALGIAACLIGILIGEML